jgi:hypothetical protein
MQEQATRTVDAAQHRGMVLARRSKPGHQALQQPVLLNCSAHPRQHEVRSVQAFGLRMHGKSRSGATVASVRWQTGRCGAAGTGGLDRLRQRDRIEPARRVSHPTCRAG